MNHTDKAYSSIGLFDSGFGGLTVMKAIRNVLPNENMIYFGDTARLPYGSKSPETILNYAIENSTFLIEQGIKMLVIPCNTACAYALNTLQQQCSIPVVGIINPGVELAAQQSQTGNIAILGTRALISSGVYQNLLQSRLPHAELTGISCPLFVPLVEEGYSEHPIAEILTHEYLRPLKTKKIDTILLACSHYTLLQSLIQKELGDHVKIIDPAIPCADHVEHILSRYDLKNPHNDLPHYQFYVSDDPDKFRMLGKTYLNYPIEHVSKIA